LTGSWDNFSISALAKLTPGAARAVATAAESNKLFKELFIVYPPQI
jgi:hypothetical protein